MLEHSSRTNWTLCLRTLVYEISYDVFMNCVPFLQNLVWCVYEFCSIPTKSRMMCLWIVLHSYIISYDVFMNCAPFLQNLVWRVYVLCSIPTKSLMTCLCIVFHSYKISYDVFMYCAPLLQKLTNIFQKQINTISQQVYSNTQQISCNVKSNGYGIASLLCVHPLLDLHRQTSFMNSIHYFPIPNPSYRYLRSAIYLTFSVTVDQKST